MSPDKPCELEIAGVDPDGFHEDEDAPVPGADTYVVSELLPGGPSGEDIPGAKAAKAKRTGVYSRTSKAECDANRVINQPGAEWVRDSDGKELCLSVRKVGCFLLRPDGYKRHRVFNLLTGFQHVTYGSEEEVDEEYLKQAASWKEKLTGVKKKGMAWRPNFQKTQG